MSQFEWLARGISLLALGGVAVAAAKPIAFAHGTTVMAEYGGNTMREAQVFYAPRFDFSLGGGYLRLSSDVNGATREIVYLRANYLAKRWNLESAQANIFVWGGLGGARTQGRSGTVLAENVGAQFDYETRRVYASAKFDLQRSTGFLHRIDTVQLGFAPYAHEYDRLATWFLVQGRRYTGRLHDGTETAFLIRLFKANKWLDAGVTDDGKLQAVFMINF